MNKDRVLRILQSPLLTTALVCALLFAVASAKLHGFGTLSNFIAMLESNAYLGIIAVGGMFVILAGGIDLSVGTGVIFATVLFAEFLKWHWGFWLALPVMIAIMTLGGLIQGLIIELFAVPPFLITLGGLFLYRGMALLMTTEQLPVKNPTFSSLADWSLAIFPRLHLKNNPAISTPIVMLLATLVIAGLVLTFTRFGRNVYAVGGSENSALLMGLPVGRSKVAVYAISGFCVGLASIAALCMLPTGDPGAPRAELEAIAIVVIGGTALTGGVGSVTGTFLGILIYSVIGKIVQFESAPPAWTRISVGVLLLAFILLQQGLRKLTRLRA